MFETLLMINNRDVQAPGGATFERRNPMDGTVATRAAAGTVTDASAAADAARAAWPAWAALGPTARRALLLRAGDALAARRGDFVSTMAQETGSAGAWAGFNVQLAAGMLREAAALTTQVAGEVIPSDQPGCVALAVRRPAGVVVGIAPWNAPLIVLDDADLDAAVAAAAFGAYMNSGQVCMSTERIIVEERIGDAFMAKFNRKVSTLVAGDPSLGQTPLGSIIDPQAAARIRELIDDAVARGARLHQAAPADGTLLSAAVLDRVTPAMRIYAEESFGPVTTVVRAANEAEAIRLANDTEYGLSSAVFSRHIARALRVAGQLETGMCHINGATVHDEAQMPFGGMNASGYGRFGGRAGVAEFTELRWITIATQEAHYPI